jgi:hypothetical protein
MTVTVLIICAVIATAMLVVMLYACLIISSQIDEEMEGLERWRKELKDGNDRNHDETG